MILVQEITVLAAQLGHYHCHQASSYSNQWAHCYDYQSQFPSTNESNHEAKYKCRDPLDEDTHLVGDGIIDLVDITAKEQRHHSVLNNLLATQ